MDVFADPNGGGFGFEEFRSDPEDSGEWSAVGGFSAVRASTIEDAVARAIAAVPWLRHEPAARSAVETWVVRVDQTNGSPASPAPTTGDG